MGIEDQIATRLRDGATPRDLIAEGFRKSTVYKVLDSLKPQAAPTPAPLLVVHPSPDRPSYPPGSAAQITFTVTNQGSADLYIFQAGVRPEWFPSNQWIPTGVRKLVAPASSLALRITVALPAELELGERELSFGVQGQWVGPQSTSPASEIMWASPMIIRIQRPPTGIRVFVSHSVFDMSWVARLEATLEDNGVSTQIAPTAGDAAPHQAVDTADIVVAVITDAGRMSAAMEEISYAKARGKQLVLLRDRSLGGVAPPTPSDLPWVDVDFSLGKATILMYLFGALNKSIEHHSARKKEQQDALGAIILGLGAVAVAIALGKGKPPTP